jgi:hypothetical protein
MRSMPLVANSGMVEMPWLAREEILPPDPIDHAVITRDRRHHHGSGFEECRQPAPTAIASSLS